MSFSSPITTRNPAHIKHGYTFLHYISYTLSTIFAATFCLSTMVLQYKNISELQFPDKLSMALAALIMIFDIISFFFISMKSKRMYIYARKTAIEKRKKRLAEAEETNGKGFGHVFLYFLYPKSKDFQKSGLIVIGFLAGLFLFHDELPVPSIKELLLKIIFVVSVVDVLMYQARYQWNDIRGLPEDLKAQKEKRLPVEKLGNQKAILLSSVILLIKIVLAWYLIHNYERSMEFALTVCFWTIIILSVLYEAARALKFDVGVFLLVSIGYPLRLLVGMWTACPDIWGSNMTFQLVLLLIAYGFLGEFSAVLPWTHEAVCQVSQGKTPGKSHYVFLFEKVKGRYEKTKMRSTGEKSFPLREIGNISDIWNISFIGSMAMFTLIQLSLHCDWKMLITEICILGISVRLCLADYEKIVLSVVVLAIVTTGKSIYSFYSYTLNPFYYFICINQILFGILYFFLRYMFDPEFDMMKVCKTVVLGAWSTAIRMIFRLVFGKEKWAYIKKK